MTSISTVGGRHYQQEMIADPERIGHARRIVAALLRHWNQGELVARAVMCVTELLSNVRRHADSDTCVLLLETSASGVRIVVSDDSPKLPVVLEPDWFSESGRGMFLLSKTADAWGAVQTENGKDVWVELRSASEEAAA